MMSKAQYFSLQPSEAVIFQAAANIYAGYVQVGQVTSENSAEAMRKSIGAPVFPARNVENVIRSDKERPV